MKGSTAGHPSCLVPYDCREAMSLKEAAAIAGRSVGTIRNWCEDGIGRKVGGRLCVSRIALSMYLDGNQRALKSYLDGVRDGIVAQYYERLMPVQKK